MLKNLIRDSCYGLVALLTSLSLLGSWFVRSDAEFLGAFAFILFCFLDVFRSPDRYRDVPRPWLGFLFFVPFVAGLVLFLALVFGEETGSFSLGGLPVFAPRDHYFLGRAEVSRARFVTIAVSFDLAWHGFLIVFALDRWLAGRTGHSTQENTSSTDRTVT